MPLRRKRYRMDIGATVTSGESGLDSRAGDEATLQALNGSLTGLGVGWSSNMSLSDSIDGVAVESIGGELRVTEIDLRRRGLTGNIEIDNFNNLKQMQIFAIYGNSLNTTIPQGLLDLTESSLEYLYLCFGDSYGDMDTVYPHEKIEEPGDGDLHPSKNKTDESNIFTGTIPAPSNPASSIMKWFVLNWTDSAKDTADGISGINADLFNVTTFEGIHIFNNNNVADLAFPSGITSMSGLRHLALGVEQSGFQTGYLTGSVPSTILQDCPNLSHIRLNENRSLSFDYSTLAQPSAGHPLFLLSLVVNEITGNMPAFLFDGVTTPEFNSAFSSFPVNSTGIQGAHPEVDPAMNIKIYQYRNSSLASLPASVWTGYNGTIQPEFTNNDLTTLGTTDLTNMRKMRYLWISNNELHENIPYADWANHDPIGSNGVEFQNNRYVFKHLLYVPPNAPAGETALELWQNLAASVDYAPQKSFGSQDNYDSGTGTIDYSSILTHTDNDYQWKRNGSNISGSTATLDVSGFDAGDEIDLDVTNPGASDLTLKSETITL